MRIVPEPTKMRLQTHPMRRHPLQLPTQIIELGVHVREPLVDVLVLRLQRRAPGLVVLLRLPDRGEVLRRAADVDVELVFLV